MADKETILVELMIRLEGSGVSNRITTFQMPIIGRTEGDSEDEESQVQFETKALVKAAVKALKDLQYYG